MALQKSGQHPVFSAKGLASPGFIFSSPAKEKRAKGQAEPTWFSMSINLEYKVSDQIKIKDTFII